MRFLPFLLGPALLLTSCGNAEFAAAQSKMRAPEIAAVAGDAAAEAGNAASSAPAQERLIIRNAQLSVVVEDTDAALAKLTGLADSMGGWVVESSTYRSGVAKRGTISLRVPSKEFEPALTAIREASIEVTRESQSGEDVTDQFVDLSARLKNTEATAERVRAFLEGAKNVEEALAVNKELGQLNEQIETLSGRIKFLRDSAAFSKIDVDITPDSLNQPIQIAGWRPTGVARDALRALLATAQGLGNAVIWLLVFVVPLLLLVTLPIAFVVWLIRRAIRKRRAGVAPPPAPEEG